MSRRTERLNTLIREELSDLIRRQSKDPRLSCFLSITRVEVTPDLEFAKIYISIMGSDEEKKKAMDGLASASGFFYHELRGRLSLRHTPQLIFYKDESIEQGARILNLLGNVSKEEHSGND
jgi:ribosome-binding factor A